MKCDVCGTRYNKNTYDGNGECFACFEGLVMDEKRKPKFKSAERKLAELFHDAYEKQAVKLNWRTQKSCRAKPFSALPKENKETMLATAKLVLRYYTEKAKLLGLIESKIKELSELIEYYREKAKKSKWSEVHIAVNHTANNLLREQIEFLLDLKRRIK